MKYSEAFAKIDEIDNNSQFITLTGDEEIVVEVPYRRRVEVRGKTTHIDTPIAVILDVEKVFYDAIKKVIVIKAGTAQGE